MFSNCDVSFAQSVDDRARKVLLAQVWNWVRLSVALSLLLFRPSP